MVKDFGFLRGSGRFKFTLESVRSLRNLKTSGTIFPCSKFSARFAIKRLNLDKANLIVELGCGSGVFTYEILRSKRYGAEFFGIEVNKNLVNEIKRKFPRAIIYHDGAENLSAYLSEGGMKKADCIVSTLPWAIFPESLQRKILNEVYNNLNFGGEFITISYILTNKSRRGKRFYGLLKQKFKEVKKTRVVIKNLPPAFFYHCKKPRINLSL